MIAASMKNLDKDITDDTADKTAEKKENSTDDKMEETTPPPTVLSEKCKAHFEPLEPIMDLNGRVDSLAESLLPPPDFDSTSYPCGWLIGKKRKLVNVDVVESMSRIAVQEMNRKVHFQPGLFINGFNGLNKDDSYSTMCFMKTESHIG